MFANSLIAGLSSDNVMNGVMGETPSSSQYGSGMKVSAFNIKKR